MPHRLTVDKTETTNQVILISFDSDVNTNQLTLQLSTSLLHTESFSVTRKTSEEDRVILTRRKNLFNITKVTKADEGSIFRRNKVFDFFHSRLSGRLIISLLQLLCSSQVPQTTLHLKRFQFLSESLVGSASLISIGAKVSSSHNLTETLDDGGDFKVFHGVGRLVCRYYRAKGVGAQAPE